jgi:hypothetical protein
MLAAGGTVRHLIVWLFASAMAFDAAAQAPFAAEPQRATPRQSTPPPPAKKETRPFAAEPKRPPDAERCRNYRRQITQIERREREALTTGERDQLALQRQKIIEQQQRTGC